MTILVGSAISNLGTPMLTFASALRSVLALAFCAAISVTPKLVHAEVQYICGLNSPSGWFTTAFLNHPDCGWSPVVNQVRIERFDNLPVGATMTICITSGTLPDGWVINSHYAGYSCGNSGTMPDTALITHTSCGAYQSQNSCYPPSPTGTLTVSPTTVIVPFDKTRGETKVSYTGQYATGFCVWVSTNNGTPSLWSCGGTSASNLSWPYVPKNGTSKFILTTSSTSASPVLATKTVNGTAGAQPTMSANPAQVVVPSGATTASTTVSWSAPGYSSVDWCGKVNSGAWSFAGLVTAGSGSTGVPMTAGTTYAYRVYEHGGATGCPTTGILASLTVSAVQGAAPTCSVTPSHVIVPLGQTSGPYSFTWNMPGYPSVDAWGKINTGPWQYGLVVAGSGATGDTIPVGETRGVRFYPPGTSAQFLCEFTVTASH
ncbi:MAG: hypothetical protein ACTHK2_09215 [Dokdonella sp.]|uniref:hypothetical protein n=1 Tax=Dokdonella sp. TaxID=2291710 RepID=UPI003F8156AC